MNLSDVVQICAESDCRRDAYEAILLCVDKAARAEDTYVDFKEVMYLLAIVDKLVEPDIHAFYSSP